MSATVIQSLQHGLYTLTAAPRSTQHSNPPWGGKIIISFWAE